MILDAQINFNRHQISILGKSKSDRNQRETDTHPNPEIIFGRFGKIAKKKDY